MKKKTTTDPMTRQIEAMKHCERKLRQDMPKPQIIPDKKKAGRKKACRTRRIDY